MFDFLSQKFSALFSRIASGGRLTEHDVNEALNTVQNNLLEADVPHEVVLRFVDDIKREVVGQKVLRATKPGEFFIRVVYERLVAFLSAENQQFKVPARTVMVVMGLQGSGKTTTIAKLAQFIRAHEPKRTILVASVDFCRPAAREQLELLAAQVSVAYYRTGSVDPVVAAQEIMGEYARGGYDVLILDTAGRMHVEQTLMDELHSVCAVAQPTKKVLVLDAMTGQESLAVARSFGQAVGFDGVILTKVDSQTRSGAAFACAYSLKKPVWFVGTGERANDLEAFAPDRMAKRILGMGDIDTLLERAQAAVSQDEQERLARALLSGNFTLEDFAKQIDMIDKIGSLQSLMRYLPGMGGMAQALTPDKIEEGQRQARQFRVIISSMTPAERQAPQILNASRMARVARGAGVSVANVRELLDKFAQSKQMARMLRKGPFSSLLR